MSYWRDFVPVERAMQEVEKASSVWSYLPDDVSHIVDVGKVRLTKNHAMRLLKGVEPKTDYLITVEGTAVTLGGVDPNSIG